MREKITVALVAYRRPGCLRQVTDALLTCRSFKDIVERVICSVDDAEGKGSECFRQFAAQSSEILVKGVSVDLIGRKSRRGIVGNTVLAMKAAFDSGADNVLMLEDDGVLMPDALRLAQWFCSQDFKGVVGFSLAAHGYSKLAEPPQAIAEFNLLTCPFAYVVQRCMWPFLLKNWCCKKHHPCGWSWSITYAARFKGYKFMAPLLSRCRNIGREEGENTSPGHWDLTQKDITFSDGSYRESYEVVARITKEEVKEISTWMLPEIDADPATLWPSHDAWPEWIGFGCPPEIEEARKNL